MRRPVRRPSNRGSLLSLVAANPPAVQCRRASERGHAAAVSTRTTTNTHRNPAWHHLRAHVRGAEQSGPASCRRGSGRNTRPDPGNRRNAAGSDQTPHQTGLPPSDSGTRLSV